VLADVNELVDLEQRTNPVPWLARHISESVEKHQVILIEEASSNKIQGFLIEQVVVDEANLLHIVVDQSSQSQGVGKKLLRSWLRSLPEQITEVWLEVRKRNLVAQHLYTQEGFKQKGVRKNYYKMANSNEKEDAILFCLEK